jgi:porin
LPLRPHQLALFAEHVAGDVVDAGAGLGIHRYRWAWSFSCALWWVGAGLSVELGAAQAQSVHSDEPPPAGRTYATGDWGGVRSYLEDNGVTITLSYVNDFLANVGGGIRPGQIDLGAFQPQIDIDLQKLAGWEGGHVHVHWLVTHGPFFSETYLGNILAVSNLEAGPVARLYALWYEQNATDDKWSVRTGLMLADSQFAQSKTAANFINNGISWPTFLAGNLPASGPAYPLPAPGVRVRVKPSDSLSFQAGVYSGDPTGGAGSNLPEPIPTGTVFSFRGGTFVIGEASYLPNQGKDGWGLPGAYRIGAWYHTSSAFADQRYDTLGLSLANPASTGIPLNHTGDSGIYGVIDQMLYRVPGTDDQGVSAFVRAGGAPNDRNLINFYGDAGVLYKGLPGRPDDKVGIATAYARVGENARELDADTATYGGSYFPIRGGETMIELMYQAQLAKWWTLQPDLQYIIRPGGGVLNPDGALRPNAWVVGLRTSLNF